MSTQTRTRVKSSLSPFISRTRVKSSLSPFILILFIFINVSYGSVIDRYTNSNTDAAEERISNGNLGTSSSDLELIYDGHDQAVGLRFNNLNIPNGATITNAYIQFHADGATTSTTVKLKIHGHDTDNASTFSGNSNITNRTQTSAIVKWKNIPAWNTDNEAGTKQRTPDLKTIVQEIVNRAGWNSGNSIAFIIESLNNHTKYRRAETNHGDEQSPMLHVEFTAENQAPTANAQSVSTDVNTSTNITLTGSDPENQALTYEIVNSPSHGTLTGTAPNVTYTPTTDYLGDDSFTFKVNDGSLDSAIATVSITVSEILICQNYDADNESCNTITFLDNVSSNTIGCITGSSTNGDSNSEDFYTFKAGAYGTLDINTSSPNSSDYYMKVGTSCDGGQHYNATANNTDTENHNISQISLIPGENIYFYFKETGSDEDQYQANFKFTIVTDFIAYDDTATVNPDSYVLINILKNDNPGDGTIDTDTVTIVANPSDGNVTINSDGTVTYTPDIGHTGSDSFTYTVNNDNGDTSNTATVSINVNLVAGDRDFTVRNPPEANNINGNYIVGGNINLCTYDEDTDDDSTSTGNAKPWSGECYQTYSNSHPTNFIDIDDDNTTVNSSSFELVIPDGSTVKWAGLYWQGVVHNSDLPQDFMDYDTLSGKLQVNGEIDNTGNKGLDLSVDTFGADIVKFKIPGKAYVEIKADQLDFSSLGYAGFTDVTNLLLENNITNGNYTVADIKAHQGTEDTHGNYAGWSLVVIYYNPDEKLRNMTLFDGFVTVTSSYKSDLVIDGFLTPGSPPVNSKLAYFTMDGDNGSNSLHVISENGVETEVVDPDSPSGNSIFNASINGVNNRQPDEPSARMDLDIIDITGALGTLETSATLRPRSGGDRYTASFFIMSTELYEPRVCYYQKFLDANGDEIVSLQAGDTITVSTWISNMKKIDENGVIEDGALEDADKVEITMVLDSENLQYISDTTTMLNIGDSEEDNKTDSTNDDEVDFFTDTNTSKWRVGSGATAVDGGRLEPNLAGDDDKKVFMTFQTTLLQTGDINISNQYSVSYENSLLGVRFGDVTPIDIGLCKDLNNSLNVFQPPVGAFNVVNENADMTLGDPIEGTDIKNALFTQVDSNPFTIKIVSIDDDNVSLKNFTGNVILELVDATNITEDQTSCTNAPLLQKYVNPVPKTNMFNDEPTTNYDLQYDAIGRNIRFRIKSYDLSYIDDLVPQCSVSNTSANINGVPQCFNNMNLIETYFPQCAPPNTNVCDSNNQGGGDNWDCYECITGYNDPVCSRDTFAIRPNRFDLNITEPPPYKAGNDYSITFNALDKNNVSSEEYNTTIGGILNSTIYTFKVDINDTKVGCLTGDFNSTLDAGWSFINGTNTLTSNYNQVGVVNIKIQELNTSEFAKVDVNTPDIDRLITPYDTNVSFSPDHFNINATLLNGASGYTYISSDLNMSADLNISIIAQTEDNTTTTNYNNACYAQKTDYNISYSDLSVSPLNSLTKVMYRETNTSTPIMLIDINESIILTDINETIFGTDNNGTGNIYIEINFDRNNTKVVNPFVFNVQDINVTDTNNTIGNQNLDENSTFYYGRVHAPDYSYAGISGKVAVYYEVYCKDCNKTSMNIDGNESVDSINWYVNTPHASDDGNTTLDPLGGVTFDISPYTIFNSTSMTNGIENAINVTAPDLPYKDKIKFDPLSSWLVHNPTDFMVEFYGTGNWAGQGIIGKTIDRNISRKQNKRLDW